MMHKNNVICRELGLEIRVAGNRTASRNQGHRESNHVPEFKSKWIELGLNVSAADCRTEFQDQGRSEAEMGS